MKNRRKKNRQLEAQKAVKWIWPRVATALKKRLINQSIKTNEDGRTWTTDTKTKAI